MPPEAAKAFGRDTQAYFGEKNPIKRDEIANVIEGCSI